MYLLFFISGSFCFCLLCLFLFFFFFFVLLFIYFFFFFFFFFQAEDGIRDRTVTGVQTCALPIFCVRHRAVSAHADPVDRHRRWDRGRQQVLARDWRPSLWPTRRARERSEERRVGKECRSRRSRYQ